MASCDPIISLMLEAVIAIVLPTAGFSTDIYLGVHLLNNGHLKFALCVWMPVILNTIFTGIKCMCIEKRNTFLYAPLVILQFYPQFCLGRLLYKWARKQLTREDFIKKRDELEGGLGSVGPYIESIPQAFVQTAFFTVSYSFSDTVRRLCYYKEAYTCPLPVNSTNCSKLYKCFYLGFGSNDCNLESVHEHHHFHSPIRMKECDDILEHCDKLFENCVAPIKECITNCTDELSVTISNMNEHDLFNRFLSKNPEPISDFLKGYGATVADVKNIRLRLFYNEYEVAFLLTFVLSVLSAGYGVTKFFRYSRANLFSGNWKIWQCAVVYGTNCAWLVARGASLAFFMMMSQNLMIVNVTWWFMFCILPSLVFALIMTFGLSCYDTNEKSCCGCSIYKNHALSLFLKDPAVILAPVFTPFMFKTKLELEAYTDSNFITRERVIGTSLKLSRKGSLFNHVITILFLTIGLGLKANVAWKELLSVSSGCLIVTSIYLHGLMNVIQWSFL